MQSVRVVALTIGAAATDALSYLGLGHVFPANMTGNTVLLGLGVATGDYAGAYRSSTALGAYVIAALCFGAVTAKESSPRRLRLSLAVELCLLLTAAIWWLTVSGPPHAGAVHGLIVLTVVATYALAALLTSAAYVAWHAYAALIPAGALAVVLGAPNQNEPGQDGYERASGSRSGDGAEKRQQTSEGGDLMSQWSDEIQKAEQLAKDHPQQADEALQKGEQFSEERTDHRFDKQIGAAGDQVEQRYGGGQQGQDQDQGQGQQDPQNQGQEQSQEQSQDQGQQ